MKRIIFAAFVLVVCLVACAYATTPITINDVQTMARLSGLSVHGGMGVTAQSQWSEKTGTSSSFLLGVDCLSEPGQEAPAQPLFLPADADEAFFAVLAQNSGFTTTASSADLMLRNNMTNSANSPVFSPDGSVIAFLGDEPGTIYQFSVQSREVSVLAELPVPVQTFKFVPKADNSGASGIVFASQVYIECPAGQVLECTASKNAEVAARGQNSWRKYTQLYIRHWDTWEVEGAYNHLLHIPVHADSQKGIYTTSGSATDLMYGQLLAAPVPPFGGSESFEVSPDGSELAFTGEVIAHDTAWSTGWNVYTVSLEAGSLGRGMKNLTDWTVARAQDPHYSPDGTTLGWLQMTVPQSESDRLHLMLLDRSTGKNVSVDTSAWDRSIAEWLFWPSASGSGPRYVLATASDMGYTKLFSINTQNGQATALIDTQHNGSPVLAGNKLYMQRNSMAKPNDVWSVTLSRTQKGIAVTSGPQQLTFVNSEALANLWVSDYSSFNFTNGGDKVYGWSLFPRGYDAKKKKAYPLVQLIHGGPEGAWDDSWSTRWNPQLWAAAGYVVIAINPHGSTGYGQKFTDAVQHNWGGLPFQDLMLGNEYFLKNNPAVDPERMGACGASYGGFMINWINGNDDKRRFKCLVCHDGVFSSMSMYYSSDEVFFNENEFGPPPFMSPQNVAMYRKYSPELFVQNWETPMMIVHGGRDYRIPLAEGIGAFTALQRKGIDSQLLYFEEENHWVLKPQNSIKWYEEVLAWLGKYTDMQ